MHRNLSASRRPPRPSVRRRRRVVPSSGSSQPHGRGATASNPITKVLLLSCAVLALLMYFYSKPAAPPPVHGNGRGEGGLYGDRDTLHTFSGVPVGGWNGTVAPGDRQRWEIGAGWAANVLSEDLEDWAPVGPDLQGVLPRTAASPEAQPMVMVGWGFGSTKLTLYTYRALESILHVYPAARVRFITIGPRYAYFYKWANIIALTQFQKYSKRGYDVKVEIFFGKMYARIKMNGRMIPGHQWWQRHENSLLFGKGMQIKQFQTTQDAIPDVYVTIFLALLELYKHGGIYVDLTTFFVRPLPADRDGFVAGGEGPGPGGPTGDCSMLTSRNRLQRPFVMQYRAPQHPVVACVLGEYDVNTSVLNECVVLTKATDGKGGMDCVLDALERCTEKLGMQNDLRLAGVVEWHGCSDETARSYASVSSTGTSGADVLKRVAAIPPPPSTASESGDPRRSSGQLAPAPGGTRASDDSSAALKGGPATSAGAGEVGAGAQGLGDELDTEEAKELLLPSSDDGGESEGERSSSSSGVGSEEDGGGRGEQDDEIAPKTAEEKEKGQDAARQGERAAQGVDAKGLMTEKFAASATDDVADDDDHAEVNGSGGGGRGGWAGSRGNESKIPPVTAKEMIGVLAGAVIGGEGGVFVDVEERSEDHGDDRRQPSDDAGEGGGKETDETGEVDDEGGKEDDTGGEETEEWAVEEGAVSSRASVSSSTAATNRKKRDRKRRRNLVGTLADGEAGAGSTDGEAGSGSDVSSGGVDREAVALAARAAADPNGSNTEGSRALVAAAGVQELPEDPAEKVSLLWIGSMGSDGSWRRPEEESLWAEVFSRLRLTRWQPQQVSKSCRIPCGHWDTLSPEGSKAPTRAKEQAEFQCAPRVFVPGTQKGASTFLFHAISWHPQVLQPLRGAHGFKETGRYSLGTALGPQKLGLRLAAFPFIEEHENFATGDGTVTYMLSQKTAEAILADNPHAKIVFALRDPVARAWSDYRFLWGVYTAKQGFPAIVDASLDKIRACFDGRLRGEPRSFDHGDGGPGQLVVPGEEAEAIELFFSPCSHVKDPGQIVKKGIYYYQVLHWMRVFGRDNVMVVDSADLKSRQKETIEEVYRFLGLCPVDVSRLEPENVTVSPRIPEHMKIDAKTFKAMQDFYEPFNKRLYKLLGRDLGWEKNTFKARR